MAEPPYGEIVDLLKSGQVVPFLGAGVNFGTRQPPGAKWVDKSPTFLPKPKRSLTSTQRNAVPSKTIPLTNGSGIHSSIVIAARPKD